MSNPHKPTGSGTPNWVIWVMVAIFLLCTVGALKMSVKGGPAPDSTPSPVTTR